MHTATNKKKSSKAIAAKREAILHTLVNDIQHLLRAGHPHAVSVAEALSEIESISELTHLQNALTGILDREHRVIV